MIATLQSLRFVFVMMIFMSHFVYGGRGAFDAGGDGSVAFFFILSGFVLSLGYGDKIRQGTFCYRRFLWRRLLKVYPLHLLCLLGWLVVSKGDIGLPVLLNTLLLQCWIPVKDYYFSCNSVSWFLSCMLFCYLVFPCLYRHVSVRLITVTLILYAVVCVIVPYDKVNNILYVNPLVRMVDFMLGIALYHLYKRYEGVALPGWLEWVAVGLVVFAFVAYPYVDAKVRNAPLFWGVLLPFIFIMAYGRGPVSRFLSIRTLTALGALSMPVFLIHPMTISMLTGHLPSMPYLLMLTTCIVVVLLLSIALDRFFLHPIERWWRQ